jgi:TRAP-type C4-dicarboxylate transport system substrate-binding protein
VAPRLQFFDFPFLWRDADHVHGVVDGAVGGEAAEYMEEAVRVRPLAFSDSFGFRQVVTRSRDVTEPGRLAGLKIRTIQSAIYVRAVELMGASATPMAFGEVYTSLETGVIDGYEHDASTTLQQRFYEVAGFMARTRHIAGVLGLYASSAGLSRVPRPLIPKLEEAAQEAARRHRAMGASEEREAMAGLEAHGMKIRDIDSGVFIPKAETLWRDQARELDVGRWLAAARA